jgi:hypothetical protein
MNATHFFERRECHQPVPACSESFWTAMFALFLLHLSRTEKRLRVWSCTDNGTKPWYRLHRAIRELRLPAITLHDMAIEPRDVMRVCPNQDISLVGISPDVLVCLGRQEPRPLLLVENKVTTGAMLNHNQIKAYLDLVRVLPPGSLFLVLKSVGCSTDLYQQVHKLAQALPDRFGILLWEDVLQAMARTAFELPGLEPQDVGRFVADADGDCEGWPSA